MGLALPSSGHPDDAFTGGRTPTSTAALLLQGLVDHHALDLQTWSAIRVFLCTWKWSAWQTNEREQTEQLNQYLKARDGDQQSRQLAAPHWGSVGCPLSTWEHCLFKKKLCPQLCHPGPILGCLSFPWLTVRIFWCVFQGMSNSISGLFALTYCFQPWLSFQSLYFYF